MAPKLIQCIKFSFSLTAEARFKWINNKSIPHSSSVFACSRGKNTMGAKFSLPPFHWLKLSHHLVSGESTLLEVTLFEARSRIFLPTARLYSAAASTSERLRSNGSLAIMHTLKTGLIADKFASFWMFPKGLYHSLFCFINDLYILYNYWLNTWKT